MPWKIEEQPCALHRTVSGDQRRKFRLRNMDPADTGGMGDGHKPKAKKLLADGIAWLAR